MSTNGSATPIEVQTLYLVVIDLDGSARVVIDPEARFSAQRLATPKDVYPSLANCLADYQAIKTAEAVMTFQAQLARQAAVAQAARQEQEDTPLDNS